MRPIDPYSYHCGVMDSFCEIVGAGVKPMALSHPFASPGERAEYREYAAKMARQYGVLLAEGLKAAPYLIKPNEDELSRLVGHRLTDTDELAGFTLGPKHILFEIGGATVVCRLLEGEFLDWRKVVPTDCPIKLTANVGDLSSSISRVGLIVSEKYKSPVRCVFSDQTLLMKTNTTIGAAEDRCAIAGDGKELEIGFNVRYLSDALRAVPSEEVVLELTNGLSPIVLTPADNKYDFAYMVLPVRIKNG